MAQIDGKYIKEAKEIMEKIYDLYRKIKTFSEGLLGFLSKTLWRYEKCQQS